MRRLLGAIVVVASVLALLLAWDRERGGGAVVAPGEAAQRVEPPEAPIAETAPSAATGSGSVEPRRIAGPFEATEALERGAPAPLESGGLRVLVVDADGAPAPGVEVALAMTSAGFDGADTLATATSRAPDGLARLGLEELEQKRRLAEAMDLQLDFHVAARVASATPVRAPLEGWPADGDEVRLQLPPTGSLLVRVLREDGVEHTGPAQVNWWWLPADVAAADPRASYERVREHSIEAENGEARVDGIGLGLTLSVNAWAQGFVGASQRGVEGPTAPGELRTVELRLGAPMARLRWRVLDFDGAPLVLTNLRGEVWSDPDRVPHPAAGSPQPSYISLETDAEGYAELQRAPGELVTAPRLDLERRARHLDPELDASWSVGSLRLPTALAPGELVELGDLRLAPVPVVAEGRVANTDGAPIADANLRFHERWSADHRYQNFGRNQRTGADGRFLLRETRLPRELAVTVSAKGYATRSEVRLEPGARDVSIALEPAAAPPPKGAVAVEVLLDPPLLSLRCLLRLERRGGGGRSPDWFAGHRMEIDGLAPGTYDVRVETRDGDFELGRVEGVEVRAGEVAEDARLLPFDLRGTLRMVELELVRPDGAPWRRRDVRVQPLPDGRGFELETDDEGRAHLLVPSSLPRVRLALEEGHAAELPLGPAEGPRRVVLGD